MSLYFYSFGISLLGMPHLESCDGLYWILVDLSNEENT